VGCLRSRGGAGDDTRSFAKRGDLSFPQMRERGRGVCRGKKRNDCVCVGARGNDVAGLRISKDGRESDAAVRDEPRWGGKQTLIGSQLTGEPRSVPVKRIQTGRSVL